jgi:hypothetical protein
MIGVEPSIHDVILVLTYCPNKAIVFFLSLSLSLKVLIACPFPKVGPIHVAIIFRQWTSPGHYLSDISIMSRCMVLCFC